MRWRDLFVFGGTLMLLTLATIAWRAMFGWQVSGASNLPIAVMSTILMAIREDRK